MKVQIGLARPEEIDAIWELYKSVWLATYPNQAAGVDEEAARHYLLEVRYPQVMERWQRALVDSS